MKRNMSNPDRIIRFIIAFLLITAYLTGLVSGTIGIILLVIAGIFLVTSFIGTCPVYALFGISTCKVSAGDK